MVKLMADAEWRNSLDPLAAGILRAVERFDVAEEWNALFEPENEAEFYPRMFDLADKIEVNGWIRRLFTPPDHIIERFSWLGNGQRVPRKIAIYYASLVGAVYVARAMQTGEYPS